MQELPAHRCPPPGGGKACPLESKESSGSGFSRYRDAATDGKFTIQVGEFQQVTNKGRRVHQDDHAVMVFRVSMQERKSTQTGAIDVVNSAKIKNNLLVLLQQRAYGFRQRFRFLVEHDPTRTTNNRDVLA